MTAEETPGNARVSKSYEVNKDGVLVEKTIHVITTPGTPEESEELKKLRLEQEKAREERKAAERKARAERLAKEKEEMYKREAAERTETRRHVENMSDKADARWWRYLLGAVLGAAIVWFSWYLFVCSECMANRVGDPDQNEFPINGDEYVPPGPEPAEPEASNEPEEEVGEDSEEVAETEEVEGYGIYTPGNPDLMISLVAHFSGPERHNFRKFGSDSLDGENKYVLLAAQLATLIESKLRVVKQDEGKLMVVQTTYSPNGILSSASEQFPWVGDKAKYHNAYENFESFEYWVNSTIQDVPSSSETDFSRAVRATIDNFHEALNDRNIGEIHGIKFAAVKSSKPKARKTDGTKKRRVSSTPPSSAVATIPKDFYQNPVPGSTWKERHWDGKKYARDMMAKTGTPVYASASGKVIRSGYGGARSGMRVTISDKYAKTFYGHLSKVYVKKGQRVKKGQLIGLVGHTGSAEADAPHLHLEFFPKVKNFRMPTHDWH